MTSHKNDTVVITGGCGFIGRSLAHALLDRYHVVLLDRNQPPPDLARADYAYCDVTDEASVNAAIAEAARTAQRPIASVIHLAAYYDFAGEPSDLYEQVTVRGTQRVLRALRQSPAAQFIFSSTMLVHKPTTPGSPIDESHPLEGRWDYPSSKIETEDVIRSLRGPMPVVLLRIAGVYTDDCGSIPLSHQIQRVYERRLTAQVFPGDVNHGQSFIHIDDAVDAFVRAIDRRHDLPPETTLLIGEPQTYSYDQIQRRLAQLLHDDHDWRTTEIPKPVAKAGAWIEDKVPGLEDPFIKPWMIELADDHYELDITRARDLLGWNPKHTLIDTLPKMVAALKQNPKAWYKDHDLEPTSALEPKTHAGKG